MAANGDLPQMPQNTPRFLDRFSKGAKVGFFVLGFILGIIGILISWAIGHRKKMMECSAEAIWYAILGWGVGGICTWYSYATGTPYALYSLFGSGITVWAGLWLACYICFIILSMLWIYGLRPKMNDSERAYQLRGDDWIKPDEKHLRYDAGITVNALPDQIWPYMQQAGQSKAGWYSFERLERLFTFDIRNHYDYTKYPQWQNLHVGEFQWFHQAPLSIGEWVTECSNGEDGNYFWAAHSDSRTDPSYKERGPEGEAALKLWFKHFCWTWNWEVYQINETQSRFIYRCDCSFAPFARTPIHKYFVVFILGTASIVMGRCCMETITKLSEGQRNFRKRYFD
jgi:Ca2+/Na+ antiporter